MTLIEGPRRITLAGLPFLGMELFYSCEQRDGALLLDADESAHCVRVLRHRRGDAVNIIDGRGTMYDCILEDDNPKGAVARIIGITPGFGGHPYSLTMAVCPTKNIDRYEWFAEKATEIGLDAIVPVIGERSERKVIKTERLSRLVLSAAKQSLKALVPEISECVSVREFIAAAPADAVRLICHCAEGPRQTVASALAGRTGGHPDIRILIGPEGDFSPAELEMALASGWIPVSLGTSRLRTETAALVAVTQVYSLY